MGAITATPEVLSLLGSLKEVTEIRDIEGHIVGVFTPRAAAEEEPSTSVFTWEEVQEAERALAADPHGGRPLKEFWDELLKGQETSG